MSPSRAPSTLELWFSARREGEDLRSRAGLSPPAGERIDRTRAALATGAFLTASAIAVIAIARAVQAGRTGSFDPSLASRMGSDALKFPIQLAYVLTFSAILASIGFLVGRRVIEAQLLLCGSLAGISTFLFYRWGGEDCIREDAYDFTVLAASLLLAVPLGIVCARRGLRWMRLAAACLPLLATMVVIAHVQMWHCAPSSQQIGREFIAPFVAVVFSGPLILVSATLGWWLNHRISPSPGGVPAEDRNR
jgi:hypothetical protein